MHEEENNMHQDPNNWKFGFFYFNPKDKRVWVFKRIPYMGLTINFANPYSVLVILIFIVVVVLLGKTSS